MRWQELSFYLSEPGLVNQKGGSLRLTVVINIRSSGWVLWKGGGAGTARVSFEHRAFNNRAQ